MKPPLTTGNRIISDDEDDAPILPASTITTSAAQSIPDLPRRQRRRNQSMGSYPGKRQVTAYVDKTLFLWLKRISAQNEKPMLMIFEEALTAYVNSFAAQKKFQAPQ